MPPLPSEHEPILRTLRATRSCEQTATVLGVALERVQRVAWMAFGLGELEVGLVDF